MLKVPDPTLALAAPVNQPQVHRRSPIGAVVSALAVTVNVVGAVNVITEVEPGEQPVTSFIPVSKTAPEVALVVNVHATIALQLRRGRVE